MIEAKDIAEVGQFFKTHALKGELNAVFDIDAGGLTPETPLVVDMDGIFVPFFIEGIRSKGARASLVKLQGVDSEAEARDFVNKAIYIRCADCEMLSGDDADEEGGYADEFIGYTVCDAVHGEIGTIGDVDLSTQNALFIVDNPEGTVYIPISEDFIDNIDTENRVIRMNLPEGIVNLNL